MANLIDTTGAIRARSIFHRQSKAKTRDGGSVAEVESVLVFNDHDAAIRYVRNAERDGRNRRTYQRDIKAGGLVISTWVVIERERGRVDAS